MNPDHWYPVELDAKVKRGQSLEVTFWRRSIALYRGDDGVLRAIDNRCAHRQVKLTEGKVSGCNLVCLYHGWGHDGDGKVAHIPHDLFGHQMPRNSVGSYPVQVRHGLIWIFPGDPTLAQERKIPDIPELDGPRSWYCVPVDATWNGHHSMIIDNVSDFTHAYLHRKYKPFTESQILELERTGDQVFVSYRTTVGASRAGRAFINPSVDTGSMRLCYQYPYQWSNTGGKIKHWCFVLPIDERTTRAFFLFMFAPDVYRIPFTRLKAPRLLTRIVLWAARRSYIVPLLDQDRVAIEAEQAAHERLSDAPIPELNPAVKEFQKLTIERWTEHVTAYPTTARPSSKGNRELEVGSADPVTQS